MLIRLAAGAYFCAALAAQNGPVLVITGARVFDGTPNPPAVSTVVVRGNRIVEVGPSVQPPPGAVVIDGAGKTLLPGLFDLHTHLPYSAVAGVSGDWGKSLKAYLYCGVTSVVDFGIYPEQFEPMRRLVREGVLPAPRLHMAARMSTPGGHGLEGGRGDFHTAEVLTPREARNAAKRILEAKPDAIKVFTDGWRYGAAPDMTSMEEDTLRAIVEEAHARGVEVLTHTVTLAKAKVAARAGVDVIAHGIGDAEADAELLGLMTASRTSYAPTLAVYEPRRLPAIPELLAALLEPLSRAGVERRIRAAAAPPSETNMDTPRLRRWKVLLANTAHLRGGRINIATGTDAGVSGTWHGWATLRELQLLVQGGLTPVEALAAATGNAARAIHVEDERGFIAAGKLADLVLVDGAPEENIADIERVSRVWLNGKELDRGALARAFLDDGPSAIPARKAAGLIDDFESRDGRTNLGTLRVNSTDGGHDHSRITFIRIVREGTNHALAVIAKMGDKARPEASVVLPLSRGGVEPVDASHFRGVEFEARGEGAYRLTVERASVRDYRHPQAPFEATGAWKRIRIPFGSLKPERGEGGPAWTGRDLLQLSFDIARGPGEMAWLELDNVRFYQ
jgi:imidazolonepropionase-like amidohydrolase